MLFLSVWSESRSHRWARGGFTPTPCPRRRSWCCHREWESCSFLPLLGLGSPPSPSNNFSLYKLSLAHLQRQLCTLTCFFSYYCKLCWIFVANLSNFFNPFLSFFYSIVQDITVGTKVGTSHFFSLFTLLSILT